MIRRVTRWVTSFGIAVLDGGNVPGMLNCQNTEYRIPITIEYDDGTGEPLPATRERVVEGWVHGTWQDGYVAMRFANYRDAPAHDLLPARLIITEPVPEMTLLAAVEAYVKERGAPADPNYMPYRNIYEAAARERAKVKP